MNHQEVIIIGGSYAGLSAAMALGRSSRDVLIIDGGDPCNKPAPHSHNFLTRDGEAPGEIAALGLAQVLQYPTVHFLHGEVQDVIRAANGFAVGVGDEQYTSDRILLATGVRDLIPDIPGFSESWGKSIVHCPYCHGYEIRGLATAVYGSGDAGFEYARFLYHWTRSLTLVTNGPSMLSHGQRAVLQELGIGVDEREISSFQHEHGNLSAVVFTEGPSLPVAAMYARIPFVQKSTLAESLGCELDAHGLIKTNDFQKTSVPGVFAAGDCCTMMRSVALSVASGGKAGAFMNHEMISATYKDVLA